MNIQVHVVPRTVSEQGIQFPEPVVHQEIQTSLVFKAPPKDAVPQSCMATQTEGMCAHEIASVCVCVYVGARVFVCVCVCVSMRVFV